MIRVGRFIHQRLDERLQRWNLLRGEISFIGPRPECPGFVRELPRAAAAATRASA